MVKRNVSFYERKKLSQNQELCTNGKVHIMDFFGWRKRWYYGFLGLKGDHSNEANKNKKLSVNSINKKQLKDSWKAACTEHLLATTTCHTLMLGLKITISTWYIFQMQIMLIWARCKSLYICVNTIYVIENQHCRS